MEVEAPSPFGYLTQYHWDGNSNLVQQDVQNVDKDNNVVGSNPWFTTTYTYTCRDQLASITEEIASGTTRTTTFTYDENGNRVTLTKPQSNVETWTYDRARPGDLPHAGLRRPGASTVEFEYDDNGNLVTQEDGRNNDTTYTYDLFDRRTKTTNALSHYEQLTWTRRGT